MREEALSANILTSGINQKAKGRAETNQQCDYFPEIFRAEHSRSKRFQT